MRSPKHDAIGGAILSNIMQRCEMNVGVKTEIAECLLTRV